MSAGIKVIFSSINLAQTPQALRGPEWLGEFARGAKCDGVEYMPMFDILPGHTPQAIARAVQAGGLVLNSLHASFREVGDSVGTNNAPDDPGGKRNEGLRSRVINGPLGRLLLPEVCESAAVMGDIQRRTGTKVPVVLYPQASAERDYKQIAAADASIHLFQPTDHNLRIANAATLEQYDHEMHDVRGYGYVMDTFHMRRRYGRDEAGAISDVRRSTHVLAPHMEAIHLSLNRTDIPGEGHIPTEQEARNALKGEYTGELRNMLDTAKRHAPNVGFAVIEATSGSIGELTGHTGIRDVQNAYADIADGFRAYWQEAA